MAVAAKPQDLTIAALAKKAYLKPRQRQELEKSTSDIRAALRNPRDLGQADPNLLRKQLRNEERMLKTGTPPEYDTASLNKIKQLEQHLRNEVTNGMPTYTQMERGRPTDIDHHVAWEKANKNKVLAWKTCRLILDPYNGEPNFRSIAILRGDTVRGDPRQFKQNFDQIRWGATIEEDLIRDMDDEEYHTFLSLKAVDWTKPSICKQLHWTPKQYEAAMERLRQAIDTSDDAPAPPADDPPKEDEKTHRQFGAELRALGITRDEFCDELNMSVNTYKIYERTGWSKSKLPEAEAVLARLTQAVPYATEPSDDEEPDASTLTEPGMLDMPEPA